MARRSREPVIYQYNAMGSSLMDQPGSGVVRGLGHAVFIVSVGRQRYLFNGNDCVLWARAPNAVGGLPPDGFHVAQYRDCVRPLMERSQPIQMAEFLDERGDCKAVSTAFYVLYNELPGDPAARVEEMARIGIGATGVRSLCLAAEEVTEGGAGDGAGARRVLSAMPVAGGKRRRR